MSRILAREITKSLSKALVPLQNEINDLKTTSNCTENSESWQSLKEENQKLQTKMHQLEINNTKLKMKLSWIEDKLVDNNLLFCGIGERNGESEKDRYEAIL